MDVNKKIRREEENHFHEFYARCSSPSLTILTLPLYRLVLVEAHLRQNAQKPSSVVCVRWTSEQSASTGCRQVDEFG